MVATSLKVHYHRLRSDYTGWQIHTWNAAQSPAWNAGWNADRLRRLRRHLRRAAGRELRHGRLPVPRRRHQGRQRRRPELRAGVRRQRDLARPGRPDDLHEQPADRAGARHRHAARALHPLRQRLRATGACTCGAAAASTLSRLPGVATATGTTRCRSARCPTTPPGSGEIVFDIPVLNPRTNPGSTSLEFIIHGMPPNINDKDGRPNNIHVDFGGLTIANQVGQVWLVEQDATVYTHVPDLRSVSTHRRPRRLADARAREVAARGGRRPGQAVLVGHRPDRRDRGPAHRRRRRLDHARSVHRRPCPPPPRRASSTSATAASSRVRDADAAQAQDAAHRPARAGAGGRDRRGAERDDRPGRRRARRPVRPAPRPAPLGATVDHGKHHLPPVGADGAQRRRCTPTSARPRAPSSALPMTLDAATGVWSLTLPGDWNGLYYALRRAGVRARRRRRAQHRHRPVLAEPVGQQPAQPGHRPAVAAPEAARLGRDAPARHRRRLDRHDDLRAARARLLRQRPHRARGAPRQVHGVHRHELQRHAPPARARAGRPDRRAPDAQLRHRRASRRSAAPRRSPPARPTRRRSRPPSRPPRRPTATTGATTRSTSRRPKAATRPRWRTARRA